MRTLNIKELEAHGVRDWEGQRNSSGTLFIHSSNISRCLLCARLCGVYWELGKANLVSRLEFFLAKDGDRCHISHGGLTVRRNNPNSQRLNVIEFLTHASFLCGRSAGACCTVIRGIQAPSILWFCHFLGLQYLLLDSVHLAGRWWKAESQVL